jgi:hypothetical protein
MLKNCKHNFCFVCFDVKYLQRNYFLISLKIFYGIWLVQKNNQWRKHIDNKILSLASRILATVVGFRRPMTEFGLAKQAGIRLMPEYGDVLPPSPDSGQFLWNLATVAGHHRIPAKIFRFRQSLILAMVTRIR